MAVNRLPFEQVSGEWYVSHGNFDDPDTNKQHSYVQPFAWDIPVRDDSIPTYNRRRIHAARAGQVIDLRKYTPGDKSGPGDEYDTFEWFNGNYVVIRHVDGTTFSYSHFANSPGISVSLGQYVFQGKALGYVGETGHADGIHLHIQAHTWKRIKAVGLDGPGRDVGASMLVHFEDPAHEQPWRPISGDAFSRNPLELRQDGWRRCLKCSGLFFQEPADYGFWYKDEHGLCPAGGGHYQNSWYIYSLSVDPRSGGDENWRYCRKCRVLFKGNANSVCPLAWPSPEHDPTGSANYRIPANAPNSPGQTNWRECFKCLGLYQTVGLAKPPCPAGGNHISTSPLLYKIHVSAEDTQQRWRGCNKCRGLFYSPFGQPVGVCPKDSLPHNVGRSNYTLSMNVSPINISGPAQGKVPPQSRGWQHEWKFCNLCNGLYYGPRVAQSACRGAQLLGLADQHLSRSSRRYTLLVWHGDPKPSDTVSGWRLCRKCQGLWLPKPGTLPWCPAGSLHKTDSGSGMYLVFWDAPPTLNFDLGGWGEAFGGSPDPSFTGPLPFP